MHLARRFLYIKFEQSALIHVVALVIVVEYSTLSSTDINEEYKYYSEIAM